MAIPIISRAQAKAEGLKRYFTGLPCTKGHLVERYVGDQHCVECARLDCTRRYHQDLEASRLKVRLRYHEDPKASNERAFQWRQRNPEKRAEIGKRWQRANLDKCAGYSRLRQEREKNAPGFFGATDIVRIYLSQNGLCACCGTALECRFEVDHVMPLALGGTNWPGNLQFLCGGCNRLKGAQHPSDFCQTYKARNGVWPLFWKPT